MTFFEFLSPTCHFFHHYLHWKQTSWCILRATEYLLLGRSSSSSSSSDRSSMMLLLYLHTWCMMMLLYIQWWRQFRDYLLASGERRGCRILCSWLIFWWRCVVCSRSRSSCECGVWRRCLDLCGVVFVRGSVTLFSRLLAPLLPLTKYSPSPVA